ncbi:MAG: hypothetical protein EXS60_01345 [Candidatus Pacebacteria bacterium]|nr:hypothetical protein [Candidatus Paceibacterota bacterium]
MRPFPNLDYKEFTIFKKLKTPAKVQDFIDRDIRINFETKCDTYHSPLMALQASEAHCAEGAMLAAAALWYHGHPPLLLDLKVAENKGDVDHVVALFKEGGYWGAISKTNHAVLRYRDPIYKTVRELALSYFNEYYFLENGLKMLRSYSAPFDLSRHGDVWLTSKEKLQGIIDALDGSRHFDILEKGMVRRLRPADPIEIQAGRLAQYES